MVTDSTRELSYEILMTCSKGPYAKRPPADWGRIQKECPEIVRKVPEESIMTNFNSRTKPSYSPSCQIFTNQQENVNYNMSTSPRLNGDVSPRFNRIPPVHEIINDIPPRYNKEITPEFYGETVPGYNNRVAASRCTIETPHQVNEAPMHKKCDQQPVYAKNPMYLYTQNTNQLINDRNNNICTSMYKNSEDPSYAVGCTRRKMTLDVEKFNRFVK